MTNELVIAPKRMPMLPKGQELMEIMDSAKLLATCPFYQKIGPGGILAIWFTAREMGLPPMMCLNGGMYTFSGAVSLSSQLINMMIVNAGHRVVVMQLDDTVCKLKFVRTDRKEDNEFVYSYSADQAAKAGYLTKDNWKKSPRDMMFARALSGGARKFMPDVMMNVYAHGELEESDATIENPLPAEVVIETESVSDEEKDELNELLARCSVDYIKRTKEFYNQKYPDFEGLPKRVFSELRDTLTQKGDAYQEAKKAQETQIEEVEDEE